MSTFDAAKANKNRNQGHDPIWQQETSQSQHQHQRVQPPSIGWNVPQHSTTFTTTTISQAPQNIPVNKPAITPPPPQQQTTSIMTNPRTNFMEKLNALRKQHAGVKILFSTTKDESTTKPLNQTKVSPDSTWGSLDFVKLPYDPCNTKIKAEKKSGKKIQVKKWDIINEELGKLKSLINLRDFGEKFRSSVLNYNAKKATFAYNLIDDPKISKKLGSIFEFIAEQAAKMNHKMFPYGIPILRKDEHKIIFLNQGQITSILANAFLCTFPKRIEGQEIPEINFYELYSEAVGSNQAGLKMEKLLCILNYFKRIKQRVDDRIEEGSIVSYERRYLSQHSEPHWEHSDQKLSIVQIIKDSLIEQADNCLQVDFANQYVGGGVLGRGAVQEEIRFVCSPELIAARLFTEKLEKNEVLIISGCEQFSTYTGYANTFKFNDNFLDKTGLDEFGRRKTKIVCMDAYNFSEQDPKKQFSTHLVKRELNKSYCAFGASRDEDRTPVATGNWGCGIFGGDPQLKFILQWMAASQAKRELRYYTVGDEQQSRDFYNMGQLLHRKQVTVGALFNCIENYYRKQIEPGYRNPQTLFEFFERKCKQ